MGTTRTWYPAEVRERAARVLLDNQAPHGPQWAAVGHSAEDWLYG